MPLNCPLVWIEVSFAEGWEDIEPDEVVWVDVMRFDIAWSKTDLWVGSGGVGGQDSRYRNFGLWLNQSRKIEMPVVWIEEVGDVGFTNVRHRFAWLRDHGVRVLPLQIGPTTAAECRQRFETAERQSKMPL